MGIDQVKLEFDLIELWIGVEFIDEQQCTMRVEEIYNSL